MTLEQKLAARLAERRVAAKDAHDAMLAAHANRWDDYDAYLALVDAHTAAERAYRRTMKAWAAS